jgi:hypothetical protein
VMTGRYRRCFAFPNHESITASRTATETLLSFDQSDRAPVKVHRAAALPFHMARDGRLEGLRSDSLLPRCGAMRRRCSTSAARPLRTNPAVPGKMGEPTVAAPRRLHPILPVLRQVLCDVWQLVDLATNKPFGRLGRGSTRAGPEPTPRLPQPPAATRPTGREPRCS